MEIKSDAKSYFDSAKDDSSMYYGIFLKVLRDYSINWRTASDSEKYFAEEIARINFEREISMRNGLPLSSVRPAFIKNVS